MSAAERLAEVEAVFKALASTPRRQILLVLQFRGGSMTAGEIQERFACSWPTTSRHLKVLTQAGLVEVETEGRQRRYHVRADTLHRVAGGWMANLSPDPAQ